MRRRLIGLFLSALLIAFCIWRISWFPYHPETLYAAIPSDAVLVSEHVALASRWPAFATHPLVRGVAVRLGVAREDLAAIAQDPGTRAILDRLAARNTLLAYTPEFGRTGGDAWILASWVGVQGQYLRWGFYKALLADFESCTFTSGRKGWRYRDPQGLFPERTLSFAVVDGVLLGCLSSARDGASLLIQRVESHADFPVALQDHLFPNADGMQDRVLGGDLAGDPGWGSGAGVWSCEFSLQDDARVVGVLQARTAELPPLGTETPGATVASVASNLRGSPGVLVIGPAELIGAAEAIPEIGPAVREFWGHLQPLTPPGGHAFISLAQPDYSGRIMGFKIATLMIGVELADPAAADAAIRTALDAFNARFNTTLIRRDVQNGEVSVTTIESVRAGPLSGLADGERPSYVVQNGWLLISSSGDALARLVAEARTPDGSPAWARDLASQSGGTLGWVDLRAAIASLKKITAMQDLLSMAQGRGRTITPVRQGMAQLEAWLEEMQGMDCLRIWAQTQDSRDAFRFELGPFEAEPNQSGAARRTP